MATIKELKQDLEELRNPLSMLDRDPYGVIKDEINMRHADANYHD